MIGIRLKMRRMRVLDVTRKAAFARESVPSLRCQTRDQSPPVAGKRKDRCAVPPASVGNRKSWYKDCHQAIAAGAMSCQENTTARPCASCAPESDRCRCAGEIKRFIRRRDFIARQNKAVCFGAPLNRRNRHLLHRKNRTEPRRRRLWRREAEENSCHPRRCQRWRVSGRAHPRWSDAHLCGAGPIGLFRQRIKTFVVTHGIKSQTRSAEARWRRWPPGFRFRFRPGSARARHDQVKSRMATD